MSESAYNSPLPLRRFTDSCCSSPARSVTSSPARSIASSHGPDTLTDSDGEGELFVEVPGTPDQTVISGWLKFRDHKKAIKRYPNQHKQLLERIEARFVRARELKELADRARTIYSYNINNMKWMNHILHKIMGYTSAQNAARHQLQNIHMRLLFTDVMFDRIPRCIKYLRLITISARTEHTENSIFVNTTWPYIIHPEGFPYYLWESVVIVVTTAILLIFPYIVCTSKQTTSVYIFMQIITCLWYFDAWVQLHTAVKTKQSMISQPIVILKYRMSSFNFLVDVFSFLPIEIAALIFSSKEDYPIYCVNRLAKVWRIHLMFIHWENNYNTNAMLIRLMQMMCGIVYLIYLTTSLIFLMNCKTCDFDEFRYTIRVAVQIITSINTERYEYSSFRKILLPTFVISWYVMNTLLSYTIVTFHLSRIFRNRAEEKLESFKNLIPKRRKDILERMNAYADTQLLYANYSNLIYDYNMIYNLPQSQYRYLTNLTIKDALKSTDIFCGLPDDLITEISSEISWNVMPPGEFLLRSGDLPMRVYIIWMGTCEMVSGKDGTLMGYKSGVCLNHLEAIFKTPVCNTVVTVTHCRIISIDTKILLQMFSNLPVHLQLDSVIRGCRDIKKKLRKVEKLNVPISSFKSLQNKAKKRRSFYNINESKKTRCFYKKEFKELHLLSFLRYVLMTVTIKPDGRFLLIWEIFRSVSAFLTSFVYMNIYYICAGYDSPMFYFLRFLDISAFLDMYLRLHVGYYNRDGVQIQHPLLTAKHYFSNALLIDFIACCPFQFIEGISSNIRTLIMVNMLKSLQLYRYAHLVYLKFTNKSAVLILGVMPSFTLIINFAANASIIFLCDSISCAPKNDSSVCIYKEGSFLRNSIKESGGIYWYSTYVATGIITNVGVSGLNNIQSHFFFRVVCIVSIFNYALFTGLTCSNFSSFHRIFLKYRSHVEALKKFMERENIPGDIQFKVTTYYQLCWERRKGQDIHCVMQPFYVHMRQDLLYELYGLTILKTWAMQSVDNVLLIKRLLLEVSQELILPGSNLTEINDICSDIYILLSGTLIAKVPGGKTFSTLSVGTIFGNLTTQMAARLRFTIVAEDIVEILCINSRYFEDILKRFPDCYRQFQLLRASNTSYILGIEIEEVSKTKYSVKLLAPHSTKVRVVLRMVVIFCAIITYLNILLYFFQVATMYMKRDLINICTLFDVFYIILLFVIHYMNKRGICIVHFYGFQNYKKAVNIVLIIAAVPLGHILLQIPMNISETTQFYIFISLKLITLFRMYLLHSMQVSNIYNINSHMLLYRLLYLVMLYILLLFVSCAVWSLSIQMVQPNINPKIDVDDLLHVNSTMKLKVFMRLAINIADCILKRSHTQYRPVTYTHTVIYIYLLLLIRFIICLLTAEAVLTLYDNSVSKFIFKYKLNNMFEMMNRWKLSKYLVERVRDYTEMIWQHSSGEIQPVFYANAPKYLKQAIASHCYLYHIETHLVFKDCHRDFQRQLMFYLKLEVFTYGDHIQFAGTVTETMYWIHRGHVLQIGSKDDLDSYKLLVRGASFGWRQGLNKLVPFKHSYKALSKTEMLLLHRDAWFHLLQYFPSCKEIIDYYIL